MNTQPINTPDRARGDEPAELDPAMVEAAAREWHENDPTEPRAWDALADDERGWYVETTRKSLSAAGVPRLVAEVERLRYDLDHSYSQREWSALTARATSAEQERDRLRAGIEGLAGDPTAQDETGTWIDRKRVADLLAGSGEQPGEGCSPEDGLLPIEQSLASALWDRWADPEGMACVVIKDDPRTVARRLREWLLAVVGQGVTAEAKADGWDEAAEWVADPHIRRGIRQANPYRAAARPTEQEQADG